MAVEVEGTSQLEEFLGILKRRAWWIVVPMLVLGALGISFAVIVPKKYVASAQVLVRDVTGGLSPNSGGGAMSRSEGQMAPHLIRSRERINEVLNELRWPEYLEKTAEEKNEYRLDLLASLWIDLQAVPNNAGAQIVNMQFGDTSPQKAYDFLRMLLMTWKKDVQSRYQEGLKGQLQKYTEVEAKLENERVELQKKMETLKRAHGLPPDRTSDSFGRSSLSMDISGQITELELLQKRDVEAESLLRRELEDLRGRFDAARPTVSSSQVEVAGFSPAKEIARLQLVRADLVGKLEGLSPLHSAHKNTRRDIAKLDKQIADLRGVDAGGQPIGDPEVVNPERLELSTQIATKQRELELAIARRKSNTELLEERKRRRDNLVEAFGELQINEAQFDAVGTQLEEVGTKRSLLEGEVAYIETDAGQFFEDLELPVIPKKATKPNPMVISVMSILAGLALGLGIAVLSEFSRNTFRSARDLSRVMVVPVLGTVNQIVTRRQRSRAFFARTALAVATLTFVSVVGYVTWAWAYDREALSEPLRRAIQGIREPFL